MVSRESLTAGSREAYSDARELSIGLARTSDKRERATNEKPSITLTYFNRFDHPSHHNTVRTQ